MLVNNDKKTLIFYMNLLSLPAIPESGREDAIGMLMLCFRMSGSGRQLALINGLRNRSSARFKPQYAEGTFFEKSIKQVKITFNEYSRIQKSQKPINGTK